MPATFRVLLTLAWAVLAAVATPGAHAERLKDIATIQGVRPNQLIGYGLVVGLDGTGDQTTQAPFTVQSLYNMLTQLGVNLATLQGLQLKNVAAVVVTATLPAFAKPGQPLDVTVSSLGNAKSLRGGTLLLTPLKGADGQVYALAQGNLIVGGVGESAGGSKTQVNHLAAGRIPAGATVERAVASPFAEAPVVRFELYATDFTLARRVSDSINARLGGTFAVPLDGRVIEVAAPTSPADRVPFLAELELVEVEGTVPAARVIVNARTGSVVMNQSVGIDAVAVAHGNTTVTVSATPEVSQPAPFSQGRTVVTERAEISVDQQGSALVLLPAQARLADVVKALNTLGVTPQDLVSILQAIKAAGALRGELEVI